MTEDKPIWRINYEGVKYIIDYRVFHLTNGRISYKIHEIEYKGRIIHGRSLERVVSSFGRLLRKV